ncbi:unnamed protein product [Orchesella dallaii]|uniref:Transmembrane protein 135 N-terminal domain-containing protein n=1 Tax=Orchesella dallaii TaxID=48710 RepID=A0ABP1S5C8_9HEXA
MAPAASKFDTLPFNCYEIGHTWTPSCAKASTDLGVACFKEGFKIYASCYVMSMAASQRIPKSTEEILKVVKDVLRSTTFLTTNAFGFMFFFCTLRRLKGNFNYFTLGFLPSVLGCYCAILVEKPQRRPLLALYVANVASETLFRMLRSRGIVQNVKHFDVLMFCTSMVTMLYYMKKGNQRGDFVDTILKKIFGAEEFTTKGIPAPLSAGISEVQNIVGDDERIRRVSGGMLAIGEPREEVDLETNRRRRPRDESYRARFIRFVLWMHRSVEDIACHLERMVSGVYEGKTHEKCPHKDPCFDYWLKGFCSRFLSGFAIQAALQTAGFVRSMLAPRKAHLDKTGSLLSNSLLYPCMKSGLGLSAMCLAFRVFSCSFRWLQGTDEPINAATSGIMASALGFFLLRPPSAAGLYIFFKAAERVISESHQKNNWKIIQFLDKIYGGGWTILYAISTAVLFHCGIMEPQNLKPSYYNFLTRVTGRKLFDINRHLLTAYYAHSNVLMKDFWPNLNEKFLSDNMKQLIKMREASGKGNELIKDIVLKFVSGASI